MTNSLGSSLSERTKTTCPLLPPIYTIRYKSPLGELELGSIGDRLCLCLWPYSVHYEAIRRRLAKGFNATFVDGQWTDVLHCAVEELKQNFFRAYDMNPLPLRTFGTPLQQDVWRQVARIPTGSTVSYSELAALAGHPAAVRAVASAVGANALNLFIPCHRVLPADGSLGNYAGLPYCKYRLLRLEGVDIEYHRRIP